MHNGSKVGGSVAAVALALIVGVPGAMASSWRHHDHGPHTVPAHAKVPKVILISLDGAKPQFIERFLATRVLSSNSGLGLLRKHGTRAIQNITETPSLTAVSHIAIATGSTAVHNDIPSNTFHAVAAPIGSTISGFAAPIGGYQMSPLGPAAAPTARPMWLALRKKGLKVTTATWPGGDGADIRINGVTVQGAKPTRTVDYTLPFGAFGGLSAQGFTLKQANFAPDAAIEAALAGSGHTSYSPVRVSTAPFETVYCAPTNATTCGTSNANGRTLVYAMNVAALDTTNDGATNYDTLVVFDAAHPISAGPFTLPSTGPAYVKPGTSAPFFFEGSGSVVGAGYYVVKLSPDLSEVRFARYGANYIPQNAAVQGDVDDVNTNVGFWAPQADFRIPERLSPGFTDFSDEELEAIYQDQVETFVEYQTDVALHAIDHDPDADLVMIYCEEPDGASHQFLLTDPRQATDPKDASSIGAKQSKAKVARYAQHIKDAYRRADGLVAAVIEKVGTKRGAPRSNVIVVSDHGFLPFHTAVNANNLLSAALSAGGLSPTLVNTSVVIRTSGPAANIYVNLAGREQGGTVDAATYKSIVEAVASYLRTATDPNRKFNYSLDRKRLFDKVFVRPSSCGKPGFCTSRDVGQDSGDIVAILAPGYNFDGTQSPGVARLGDAPYDPASTVLSVPNFYGAHGYDAKLPEMSASFYAAGPDIKDDGLVWQMHNIDVAPTIMRILGVKPEATVDGDALRVVR